MGGVSNSNIIFQFVVTGSKKWTRPREGRCRDRDTTSWYFGTASDQIVMQPRTPIPCCHEAAWSAGLFRRARAEKYCWSSAALFFGLPALAERHDFRRIHGFV